MKRLDPNFSSLRRDEKGDFTINDYINTLKPNVSDKAILLSGSAIPNAAALDIAASAAISELCGQLRSDVDIEQLGDLFLNAAALLTLAILEQLESGIAGNALSVRVGNVSMTRSEGSLGNKRSGLRDEALRMLSPYTAGDGFHFMGVRA